MFSSLLSGPEPDSELLKAMDAGQRGTVAERVHCLVFMVLVFFACCWTEVQQ